MVAKAKTASRAEEIRAQINATFKADVVQMASDPRYVVKYLSTGLLPFDIALPGGLPRGRFTEIYGGPSSLKSYLAYHSIAINQAAGCICGLIDTERTFDSVWAAAIGVNLKELQISRPKTGELAIDATEAMTRAGVDLIAFDSIAAAVPQVQAEKAMNDETVQPGSHARLFSVGLRKLVAANEQTAFLFINQTREKIGITFGSPETTPGGRAMPFYASLRMAMRPTDRINEKVKTFTGTGFEEVAQQVAQNFRISMTKSKLSRPYGQTQFTWNLKTGQIDMPKFLFAQGMDLGLIESPSKGWYLYDGKKYQGSGGIARAINDNDQLRWELECAVRQNYDLPLPPKPTTPSVSRGPSLRPRKLVARRK